MFETQLNLKIEYLNFIDSLFIRLFNFFRCWLLIIFYLIEINFIHIFFFFFQTIVDPDVGLIFMNRHDRREIIVDPLAKSPGSNTTRTVIESDLYDHVVLFDHVLRTKL